MIFKRIGAVCFALAFISAIGAFTHVTNLISQSDARYLVIIFGAIALLMNLLSFRYDQSNENSNLLYWIGTFVVFAGLILKMQRFNYSEYILIAGLLVIGLSYFYNPFQQNKDESNDDLLDN